MNVIFVEPNFPKNQRQFVSGLAQAGATVIGIGETDKDGLDDQLRNWMVDYLQVPSVCDERALTHAVQSVQSKVWVDRLEATVEAHILPVANVRQACSIPGISVETAYLCRDKPAMKAFLSDAQIPTARFLGSGDWHQIENFVSEVGYPLIVKPRSGAGAAGTSRVDNDDQMRQSLEASGLSQGGEVAIEEYVEGHEGFYDTLTVNGKVQYEFITHYYPNVLEAMRQRGISPQFITTNQVDSNPHYQEVKRLGRQVIQALKIDNAATHMEWFYGPKGLKFSEIGCRPPGVGAWDLYNVANDVDLYHQWGRMVSGQTVEQPLSRRFCTGIIALRPERDGYISGYSGLDSIQRRFGDSIIDCHFPDPGTPTQGVEAGYMANAWIRMKHRDFDELKRILDEVGQSVKVHAQ